MWCFGHGPNKPPKKPHWDLFYFPASFEGEPPFRVVDEHLVHLPLRDAPLQHLWDYILQDVRIAVAAKLGEAVLGVDVVRDHYHVLVALLREESQAGK